MELLSPYFEHQTNKHRLLHKILTNNLIVCILLIVSFFSFGILTSFIIYINGFIFGYIAFKINSEILLYNFLPHAVIESLGLLTSSSIGYYLSVVFFKYIFLGKPVHMDYKRLVKYIIISIFLIILSAYIETYISIK